MNVVDSSGWLEYFADGPNADFFAAPIEASAELFSAPMLVPTVSLYEVFKRVLQQRSENAALQAIALMQQGTVIELTSTLALQAAGIRDQQDQQDQSGRRTSYGRQYDFGNCPGAWSNALESRLRL